MQGRGELGDCRRRSQSHKRLKMQAIEDGDLMVATRIRKFWQHTPQ
jgi:hypothetical protein